MNDRPLIFIQPNKLRKRYTGEEIGIYILVRVAGEGNFVDSDYWIAKCKVCGEEVKINVTRISNLRQSVGCKHCKVRKSNRKES